MVVIGVIGILAIIGNNVYTDYIIRAQVTEGINLLEGAKVAATDYLATNGEWPNTAARLAPVYPIMNTDTTVNGPKYVQFMNTSGGTTSTYKLKIFFRNDLSPKIAGREIRFASRDKTHSDNGVLWRCQTTIDTDNYSVLPAVCRNPLNNSF